MSATTTLDLDALVLAKGAHDTRSEGVCLMEAVAWFAGRDHTDHPICVSPVLGAYGRALNDRLPDDERQQLRQFVPLLPGTAGDGRDTKRGYMALDWAARTILPEWLDLAGLTSEAAALRALSPVTDAASRAAARKLLAQARDVAWTARSAAYTLSLIHI